MTLSQSISKSFDSQWCVRVKTNHPDGDRYDGIVAQIRKGFIALREEESFELNGTIILARRVINGIRDGKYERCHNAILRQNDALKNLGSPPWLEHCDSKRDVVGELMKRDIWPGVEIVFNRGTKSAFYIGPITGTSKRHFHLRCYDAAGRWEKEYRLKYREIFRVEIDSAYCRHFNSYMRSQDGTELSHAAEPAQRSSVDPDTAVAPAR